MKRKIISAKKLRLGIAAAFMIFGSTSVFAQQQISLQEAIKQALQNKAEAKKASLQIKKAEAKIDEARASALPQVTATAGLTYNPIIQESLLEFGGQKIRAQLGQPWNSSASVQVQQAIFDQRVFTGLKAAKSTREFYILNAQLTNEQLIENVATAYYQVFVQEENLRTINESFTNTEKVRKVIKSLVDNGLAKKIDLDRTDVRLTNVSSSKQTIINGLELSKNALKFYMGIPIETDITLEQKEIQPRPELLASTLDVKNRSEIKVLEKNRELLQYNKKATEAYLYPTVRLVGNYGWGATGAKFPLTNGLNNGVLWSDYSAIGLNVNIPIFTGGSTKSKIAQAQMDIDDLDLDIENTQLSLNLDYKNAITNMENALINIESMENNVTLAEKVRADTESNYRYGLATLTEVLDADNALTQAKQNHANALLDYKQAEIKLIKAKGELNTLQNP
jgi:TolC family type I secretion outer membrane protein